MTQTDERAATAMGKAMYEALKPVADECNSRVEDVMASQRQLAQQIDRLVSELAILNGLTRGAGLSIYTRKLLAARTRVTAAGATLTSVEARVARMTQELRARHPAGEDITAPVTDDHRAVPVGTVSVSDDDSKPQPQVAGAPPAPPSP